MSPIEEQLLEAMRELCTNTSRDICLIDDDGAYCADEKNAMCMLFLSREEWVESYRVDFLLEGMDIRIAIECDGHDFHDRTKQQAAYDRARDRELLKAGVFTVRFTGSEIFNNAERCAKDAINVFIRLFNAQRERDARIWKRATEAAKPQRRVTRADL